MTSLNSLLWGERGLPGVSKSLRRNLTNRTEIRGPFLAIPTDILLSISFQSLDPSFLFLRKKNQAILAGKHFHHMAVNEDYYLMTAKHKRNMEIFEEKSPQ